MARFRQEKSRLTELLRHDDWQKTVQDELERADPPNSLVSPLLALLNRPDLRHKAAWALGGLVARIAALDKEAARVVMRRMLWSMNEESGNLGWGIPEAMGCILAKSPELAREYGRILFSYGHDTGAEDNFVDHAPLRRGVRWAAGYFAAARPDLALPALSAMVAALGDPDPEAAGLAAWALGQLLGSASVCRDTSSVTAFTDFPSADQEALLRQAVESLRLLEAKPAHPLQLFDGDSLVETTAQALAEAARRSIESMTAL